MTDVMARHESEPDNDRRAEQPIPPADREPRQLLTPLELAFAIGLVAFFLAFAMLAPPAQDSVPFSLLAALYLFAGITGVGLIALLASRWIVDSIGRQLDDRERRETGRRERRIEYVRSYMASLMFVATRDAAERARRGPDDEWRPVNGSQSNGHRDGSLSVAVEPAGIAPDVIESVRRISRKIKGDAGE